jgi:hypothetical protein
VISVESLEFSSGALFCLACSRPDKLGLREALVTVGVEFMKRGIDELAFLLASLAHRCRSDANRKDPSASVQKIVDFMGVSSSSSGDQVVHRLRSTYRPTAGWVNV